MAELRFAMIGAGFWARCQLAGWRELEGARCVALCDRVPAKAEALGAEFGIDAVYDDAERLIDEVQPDFIDIVTPVETHASLVELAAARRIPVISQKPMAPDLATAERMVAACREAGVPFFVHENWRWQTPLREVKRVLESGVIGRPYRARADFIHGFPVFQNQPFLAELEQFILTDIGSHILDTARFLFGEARDLTCCTQRVHPNIRGEDVATVLMTMGQGTTVVCNMSYAENPLEHENFPETFLFIEGERGSLELAHDYWVRVTTPEGTLARRIPPPRYAWADPAYDVVQSSIVACNADLLRALRDEGAAETNGEDNLKTVRLVFAAYESAASGETVRFS
jgi:predicted dehydrogenase